NAAGPGSVTAELAATTHTGIGHFVFPRTRRATMLINAGGSAANDSAASVRIDPGRREVSGSATSGHFCAQRNRYTIHFVARFDHGFRAFGTWRRGALSRHSTSAGDSVGPGLREAAGAGAYVTIDAAKRRSVGVRV